MVPADPGRSHASGVSASKPAERSGALRLRDAQILKEHDFEQMAFAQYTLARCTIAEGNSSRTSFHFSHRLRPL